ncbi:class I SAM-dependent methyltransferase [Nocardia pseudobrasiliensis]|nr:class I SAM-dependent methyltransferase [Nocardia pseudobrasiliensis]
MRSTRDQRSFVPAAGFGWLTPIYERTMSILQPSRQQLVERADIAPGMTVLDFGCGPGQLALLVARVGPDVRVIGVDVDPSMLKIARRRIAAAGVDIEIRSGTLEEQDFPPNSFDRIVSGFVLHHLTTPQKISTLRTMYDLLRPDGQLHIVDIGRPRNLLAKLSGYANRLSHGRGVLDANLEGRIPGLLREAGFLDVEESPCAPARLGMAFWRARR